MKLPTAIRRVAISTLFCVALMLAGLQTPSAKEKPPQVTEDGLELKSQTKRRLVYLRPGASFTPYHRVAIADPLIQFSQNWLDDYNRDQRDLSRKIENDDLERAKTFLTEQFKKTFSVELTKGGYEVTDSIAENVLMLRPALVNIQVSAPDLMSAGRSTVYAESSGQMTLYLELWDGGTRTILARVADAQADSGFGQQQTSVSNKAAADQIITSWARELCKKLDLARGKSQQ